MKELTEKQNKKLMDLGWDHIPKEAYLDKSEHPYWKNIQKGNRSSVLNPGISAYIDDNGEFRFHLFSRKKVFDRDDVELLLRYAAEYANAVKDNRK